MATDFEQHFKETLDAGGINNAAPQFDKEAEWNELKSRLIHRPKRKLWPVWSHAAALLAGIIVCWFLMRQWGGSTKAEQSIVVMPTTTVHPENKPDAANTAPHAVIGQPTPIPAAQVARPATVTAKFIVAKANKDTATVAAVNQAMQDQITAKPALPQPMPLASAPVKKPRPVAIHVLDIENEDRQFMIQEGSKVGSASIIAKIQNRFAKPDEVAAANDRPYPLLILLGK